jgi:flagellar biosynthesis protein FliQ
MMGVTLPVVLPSLAGLSFLQALVQVEEKHLVLHPPATVVLLLLVQLAEHLQVAA